MYHRRRIARWDPKSRGSGEIRPRSHFGDRRLRWLAYQEANGLWGWVNTLYTYVDLPTVSSSSLKAVLRTMSRIFKGSSVYRAAR